MTKSYVFDAGVLSLFFNRDLRVREVFAKVDAAEAAGYVAEVNAAEFYNKSCRIVGKQAADTRFSLLKESEIRIVGGADLARSAGLEKCRSRLDLSLADCFALALAKERGGVLVTTDSELGKIRDIEVLHLLV